MIDRVFFYWNFSICPLCGHSGCYSNLLRMITSKIGAKLGVCFAQEMEKNRWKHIIISELIWACAVCSLFSFKIINLDNFQSQMQQRRRLHGKTTTVLQSTHTHMVFSFMDTANSNVKPQLYAHSWLFFLCHFNLYRISFRIDLESFCFCCLFFSRSRSLFILFAIFA